MVKVALLGFGYSARTFHLPLIGAAEGLVATAAAVRSEAAAARAHAAGLAAGSVEEVLADPSIELVVVSTPTADHAEHVTRALHAGKHVVVEKPVTASLREAEAVARLAKETGRVLTVFHNRRWDADFLSLQAVLASGALGELVEVTSTWDRYRPVVRDRWRERPGHGAGVWWDLGSHMVDQALLLFGAPAELYADIGVDRPGGQAPDRFHVRLLYPSGLRVVLESRTLAVAAAPRFVVHGAAGSFVKHGLDSQEAALQSGASLAAPEWGADPSPAVLHLATTNGVRRQRAPRAPGDYRDFYPAVLKAIRTGTPAPVRASEAVQGVALLERAIESARRNRPLSL